MGICKQGNFFYWLGLVLSALLLSGCGGGDSGTGSSKERGTEPATGGNVNEGELMYKFHREELVPGQHPQDAQKHNEEIVGRPFLTSFYRLSDDGSQIENVTEQVNWVSLAESCQNGSCYKVDSDNKLIGLNEGIFTAQATFSSEVSVPIEFEVKGKLEVCGLVDNTDRAQSSLDRCLHIIEGTTGAAAQKWFTEPPRVTVMADVLRYTADSSYSNKGYTHAGYLGMGVPYATMTNYGYPEGQYARYCRDLAQIEFNGRNNWRRATKAEFDALLSNQNLAAYGWNDQSFFATSDMSQGKVEAVAYLPDTSVYWQLFELSDRLLATCVSEP